MLILLLSFPLFILPLLSLSCFKKLLWGSDSCTNVKIQIWDFFPTGKSCLKTELQFSDYYCLLAVHVLIDIWRETGKEQ